MPLPISFTEKHLQMPIGLSKCYWQYHFVVSTGCVQNTAFLNEILSSRIMHNAPCRTSVPQFNERPFHTKDFFLRFCHVIDSLINIILNMQSRVECIGCWFNKPINYHPISSFKNWATDEVYFKVSHLQ